MADPNGDQLALVRSLREQNRALEMENRFLKTGGPSDTSGGMSDDWKKNVGDQLKTLHEDFRRITGWLMAAVAGPLLAIVGLYVFIGAKIDTSNGRVDVLSNQVAAVRVDQERQRGDQREATAAINGRLDQIKDRMWR